jgi:hypothetical protein
MKLYNRFLPSLLVLLLAQPGLPRGIGGGISSGARIGSSGTTLRSPNNSGFNEGRSLGNGYAYRNEYGYGGLRNGYGYGYGGYGYGYGGYGYGYSTPGYDGSNLTSTQPPAPQDDPLADYYRQQAAAAQAAQAQTSVSSTLAPPQAQSNQQGELPADIAGAPLQTALASAQPAITVDVGNSVRDGFHGGGLFTKSWWKAYKNAWYNPLWADDWAWSNTGWLDLADFWGVSKTNEPVEYDYGINIRYEGGQVYYGQSPRAKVADYYRQAQLLASKGQTMPPSKTATAPPMMAAWKPLGVFSLVHAGQKNSTTIFQLAINKEGLLKGNCYNLLTEQLDNVSGAVDKSNWRAAWTAGKSKNVVYDSSLANLLTAQSAILVHLNTEQTDQCNFVRLRQPAN